MLGASSHFNKESINLSESASQEKRIHEECLRLWPLPRHDLLADAKADELLASVGLYFASSEYTSRSKLQPALLASEGTSIVALHQELYRFSWAIIYIYIYNRDIDSLPACARVYAQIASQQGNKLWRYWENKNEES